MSLFSSLVAAATGNPLVRRLVTRTPAGRLVADRFVAGDDLEAAVGTARELAAGGMSVSLDLLGEEVHDRDTALAATAGYLECLYRIRAEGLDANISIKLTQLGLAFDPGLARESLDRLATAAAEAGTTVTIDMEDSRFTQRTVDLYAVCQQVHGNLGVCLQAYLHRTPADLERLAPLGGHIRLCKGAYREPPEIAFQEEHEVDAAFARLLGMLMAQDATLPAVATHDDRLLALAARLGERRPGGYEVQMLFGVRPNLQRALVGQGHRLRVYVPYGSEWYAYLTRRLAERPANLMLFLRAMSSRD